MNRRLKRVKITLIPSIDFIPYMQAQASNMCEFYWLCFRFNLYYPLKENKVKVNEPDIYN